MNNALLNAAKKLFELRLVQIGESKAGGLARGRVGLRKKRNQAAIAVLWMRVPELEFPPLRVAVSLPAFFVAGERQDVRPTDRFFAPADRFRHWLPHCNHDGRKHEIVGGGDEVFAGFRAGLGVA